MRIRKLNRIRSRTAPFRQHWCHRCDAAIVASNSRCPRCHFRSPDKRIKGFELKE